MRKFGEDQCGPASLAAVLNAYGDQVTIDELDRMLAKGPQGGVLSIDLLLAARARGYRAHLVHGSSDVLHEAIAAGHPVILLLRVANAPGTRHDLYHYIVVDGFDPERGLVRAQVGDGTRRWLSLARLERAWSPTDHATLLVEPAGGVQPKPTVTPPAPVDGPTPERGRLACDPRQRPSESLESPRTTPR